MREMSWDLLVPFFLSLTIVLKSYDVFPKKVKLAHPN
jgi:hypothetical protein